MQSPGELQMFNKMVEIENLKEKVSLQFKEVLIDKLQSAKNEYPIEAFRWAQYTPYFNDGSPCIFEVMDLELLLKKENVEYFVNATEDAYEDENLKGLLYIPLYNINLEKFPKLKNLNKFFTEMNPEYFEKVFDNHVEIIFDGLEFNIENYYHD